MIVTGKATMYRMRRVKLASKQKLPRKPQASEMALRMISLPIIISVWRETWKHALTNEDRLYQFQHRLLLVGAFHCLAEQLSTLIPAQQLTGRLPAAQLLQQVEG
jgi:hypothetical protein